MVARPPHDNKPGGYKRAGRFKKGEDLLPLHLDQRAHALSVASNMNYALELSFILERHLEHLQADGMGVLPALEGRLSCGFDGTGGSGHEDKDRRPWRTWPCD